MITNAIIIISIIIFILINFIDKSNYDKTSLAIKYGAFYMPRIEVKKNIGVLLPLISFISILCIFL